MCGRGFDEEEVLEVDKKMLASFRQYENYVKFMLSEEDLKEVTEGALINDFLIAVKDRLPDVLERDKRGKYDD